MDYKVKFIDAKIPNVVAWGNLIVDEMLQTTFYIRDGKDGLWVTYPSYKKNDKWNESSGPASKEARDELSSLILGEFNKQKGKKIHVGETKAAEIVEDSEQDNVPF